MTQGPFDRLADLERELRAAVAAIPSHDRSAVIQALAVRAAERCGVADRCRTATDLPGLVRDLDEVAWAVQADVNEGRASDEEYAAAFEAARAANAWLDAIRASDVEPAFRATYEAAHALGGDEAGYRAAIPFLRR